MAQKPLREATAKTLIAQHATDSRLAEVRCAPVGPDTTIASLEKAHPWLKKGKLVAKVDELFGKRGKLGYVHIADNLKDAFLWIENLRGTDAVVGERTGTLNHFLIEPFVEHNEEYYLAFTCERHCDVIFFSEKGGVDIEDQGDSIKRIEVPLENEPNVSSLPSSLQSVAADLFGIFRSLDFSYLEFNPVAVAGDHVHLLDCVARIDTCAQHRQRSVWGSLEIPEGFGTELTETEMFIRTMDAKSGSSLKFVVLNPKGHIWTMVAGGGASIIYADDIVSQANPKELANYGEWSGNPSTDEMEAYTGKILDMMTKTKGTKALIIGGGIANFTDIAKTFAGIIKALQERKKDLKDVRIYVRRAGPNDRKGLEALRNACTNMGIFCVTHGAELPMTDVVGMALKDLQLSTPNP